MVGYSEQTTDVLVIGAGGAGMFAALHPDDSVELHFRNTIEGGKFINDQELAWQLVEGAPTIIRKLENELGVFFDRDEEGHIHQKPFAGQSFD